MASRRRNPDRSREGDRDWACDGCCDYAVTMTTTICVNGWWLGPDADSGGVQAEGRPMRPELALPWHCGWSPHKAAPSPEVGPRVSSPWGPRPQGATWPASWVEHAMGGDEQQVSKQQ